jgi:hypothetical protein
MHPTPYPTPPGTPSGPATSPAPALHLLHGRWVASCPACGYQLAAARTQSRAERRGRRRPCPVCCLPPCSCRDCRGEA